MKSSTEIAEKLGPCDVFSDVPTVFLDLRAPVIDYYGKIYQYAGDKMIISWEFERSENYASAECFFSMK